MCCKCCLLIRFKRVNSQFRVHLILMIRENSFKNSPKNSETNSLRSKMFQPNHVECTAIQRHAVTAMQCLTSQKLFSLEKSWRLKSLRRTVQKFGCLATGRKHRDLLRYSTQERYAGFDEFPCRLREFFLSDCKTDRDNFRTQRENKNISEFLELF